MNHLSKTRKTNGQLKTIGFAITGLIAVLLTGSALIRGTHAQEYPPSQKSRLPAGLVYTESNIPTENGNSILGFQRDASGKLTPLPTPSFPTGGAGIANAYLVGTVTTTLASDKELIVNPQQTRLFAVNTGSNTIAVFNIRQDGSLSPVEGSPFPSGGVGPVSLELAGDFLYVLNWNVDPLKPSQDASGSFPNYSVFRVTPQGRLIPVKNSTVEIPIRPLSFQILTSPDKHVLFGTEPRLGSSEPGSIRSFQILPNGRLRLSPNSPQHVPALEPPETPPLEPRESQLNQLLSSASNAALGIQVHPQQPILYATFSTRKQLGVYSYNRMTGELTFLKAVPNSGLAPCWIILNRAATRLYTVNSDDNSVSVYDIAKDPTTPVEIEKVTLRGSVNAAIAQLAFDSTGSFLHVVSQPITIDSTVDNGLHVLKVNPDDGTLAEVPSSPLQLPSVENSFPQGIFAN